METANDIISEALQELIVQAQEQSIQAPDFQAGLRHLNRMMAALEAKGIELGYTKVALANDNITIPDGAVEGVIYNLAVKLSTSYDITITQSLFTNAKEGMDVLRVLGVNIKPTLFPDTLPRGSGNDDRVFDEVFFEPVLIPKDAFEIGVNETDIFTVDFTLYLLSGETIASHTVTSPDKVSIVSESETDGVITMTIKGLTVGLGSVCINVTTSTPRIIPQIVYFNVLDTCT